MELAVITESIAQPELITRAGALMVVLLPLAQSCAFTVILAILIFRDFNPGAACFVIDTLRSSVLLPNRSETEEVRNSGAGTVSTAVWNGVPASFPGAPTSAGILRPESCRNLPESAE